MRYLMRLNAEKGTATKADVAGYYVGGKTGTAEKVINGHYAKNRLMTDFMAVLPADEPRYLLLIMLDEPKALAETHGFATAGWNAGPVAAKVIARVAPLLGLEPRYDLPPADQLILPAMKGPRVASASSKEARRPDPPAKEARNADQPSIGRPGQVGVPSDRLGSLTASTADR